MTSIKVKAAAKVNLTLDITGKRPDGYHNIRTVMQSVGIFDTVTLTENSSKEITVSCNHPDVPCDERNIVYKCAAAFYKKSGIECGGLHIHIEKNIPTQAGLAGGSADGAAVVVGLNALCGNIFSGSELEEIGGTVGADIPFCIHGGTVLCEGTGTTLTPLENIPECYFVLVKPPVGISTAQAYNAVDSRTSSPEPSTDKMLDSLNNIEKIGKFLRNDFEDTLNITELLDIKRELVSFGGCFGACMSGSGSTVFGIFTDKEKAAVCAEIFKERYSEVFVARKVNIGTEIL